VICQLGEKKTMLDRRVGSGDVPVSMGEETMGVRMLMLRVNLVVSSTCAFWERARGQPGTGRTKGTFGARSLKKCGGLASAAGLVGRLVRALTSGAPKSM
jgi:hypothetical protein